MATATNRDPHIPKQPLDNRQFFQRLTKNSRMVMKFEMYGTSMINRDKSDIQSTSDNSNLQGKQKKVRVIEGKIYRKCSEGK